MIDTDSKTYWATDDDILNASLELDFGNPIEVNAVLIQEFIPLGQRVRSFTIEAFIDYNFTQVAAGTTIGNRRIIKFEPITTEKLKISLVAKACPLISNIEVYRTPDSIKGTAHAN